MTGPRWAALAALLWLHPLAAQDDPAGTLDTIPVMPIPPDDESVPAAPTTLDDARANLLNVGPLHLALGPVQAGAFGSALTGRDRIGIPGLEGVSFIFESTHLSMDTGAHLEYAVDAAWVGTPAAANIASVSLKPTLDLIVARWSEQSGTRTDELTPDQRAACDASFEGFVSGQASAATGCPGYEPPFYFTGLSLYGDYRYRYGAVEVAGVATDVNQSVIGGGLEWFVPIVPRWAIFREFPRFSVGYYTVEDTETSLVALPVELEADFLEAAGSLKLNIPLFKHRTPGTRGTAGEDYPLRLYASGRGSRASSGPVREWHYFYQAQLVLALGRQVLPVVSIREGEGAGFEYDRQLLFGLVWELTAKD